MKLDESRASFIFELMQLSPPLGASFCLPFLKWPVETLVRVHLSCSIGRKMIGFLVDQLEGKDRQVWRESLVGSNSFYVMNRRD